MVLKPGGIRGGAEFYQNITLDLPNINANLATTAVQFSPVATVGTTAVEIYNQMVNPGLNLDLKVMKANLLYRFTGLNGSYVGSINYYWEVRSEGNRIGSGGIIQRLTGAWVNVAGTFEQAVGTLVTLDGTLNGQVNIGSIPIAPVRVRLTAVGIQAAEVTGMVHNSSTITFVGNVIPGT